MDTETSLRLAFPQLRHLEVTSEKSPEYNCIAWAAGDTERWWWPRRPYYWPDGAPREESLAAFESAFATCGFVRASSEDFEEGFEKIAIYALDGKPTHAARVLPNGRWSSKLGRSHDIAHDAGGVNGETYGEPQIYMVRPLSEKS